MEVLIVDDDPLLNEYLQAVLRNVLSVARVATANDLDSALERAGGAKAPDLVLLDMGLPGFSGLEALSRFRSKLPRARVAVVSATEDRKIIAAALEAGAVGYIPKTATLDVMIAAISQMAAGGTYVPPGSRHLPGQSERTDRARQVLIVDDHPVIREILQAVLRKALKDASVAAVKDLDSALERSGHGKAPDLVLLDLGLPGCTGLEALTRFHGKFPRVPVVVISATEDRDSILASLNAGAVGYIPKNSTRDVMIAAIRLVAAGGTYVPPEALGAPGVAVRARRKRSLGPPAGLSERELEVLRLLIKGYTNRRIAAELDITESTVKQHAHEVYAAFGATTRAEVLVAAARRGLRFD